jgi:hypothetical protein
MFYNGLRVQTSVHVTRFKITQVKFPKTRKKRILKKWAKNPSNFKKLPWNGAYIIGGHTIVIHPDDLKRL